MNVLGEIEKRFGQVNSLAFRQVNRVTDWWHLPTPVALLNLRGLRDDLRTSNLHDTNAPPDGKPDLDLDELPKYRTYDGSLQDPTDPQMGKVGTRFGRNTPSDATPETMPELMEPSPREVSERLLKRDAFKPAETLNVLAACWIQFENHDWFGHGENSPDKFIEVPLPEGDDWPDGDPMKVKATSPDRTRTNKSGLPPTYVNTVTHWWDGSQIYGSDEERNRKLRSGTDGKLTMDGDMLPGERSKKLDGVDLTGFSDNYWVGLALLHTLFAKEHNSICDHLKASYPTWDDEQLFLTARLVNSALMAKIHTVEWTPGILANPVLERAMNANWYGVLPRWVRQKFGHVGTEMIGGVVGSDQDHHTAPYAITEEFVAVYRLHPLLPDDYAIRDHETGELVEEIGFDPIQGHGTRPTIEKFGWSGPPLLLRHRQPGRDHPEEPPQCAQRSRQADRRPGRPGHARHPSRPRARSPPLQRLPRAAAQVPDREVRGSDGRPEARPGDPRRLRRRHRQGRPSGRAARRAAPSRLRLQRHRLPDLHPDGVAAAEERPLLHQRLLARRLHAGGALVGREQHDGGRAAAPPPGARAGARRGRQRLRALEPAWHLSCAGWGSRRERLMAGGIAQASLLENVRFNALVIVPNAVQGIFRRRRPAVAAATAAGLDGQAAALLRGMSRGHGGGPVWVRVVKDPALLLLDPADIDRALQGSPEPFAADPPAKRDGMAAFQPDAVTISRGEAVARAAAFRRGGPEEPGAGQAAEGLGADLPRGAGPDADRAGGGERRRGRLGRLPRMVQRIARRLILGDGAADDDELTELLGELMSEGNGMPGESGEGVKQLERMIARHVKRADRGSVAARFAAAPKGSRTKPAGQVPHFLFALGDTLAINAFRALAVLASDDHVLGRARESGEYLGACLDEAMRLWPTTAMLSRETTEELEWSGETIPAGTQVVIVNTFSHRDRDRVEAADRFDPEAWIDGEAASYAGFNHFSRGPQVCPGTAIATGVGELVLAELIDRFDPVAESPQLDLSEPLPHMVDFFSIRVGLEPR